LLLCAFAAGCGGGESESATTTAAKTGANQRFTTTQWEQYQADAASFQKLNQATLTKVSACSKATGGEAGALEKCVGDSLTNLATATQKLGEDLEGYTQSVAGACLTAINGLLNYTRPYEASIASLQNTIDADNYAAAYSATSSMQTARSAGQAANATVKTDCAPV